jgi:uncharacterized protein
MLRRLSWLVLFVTLAWASNAQSLKRRASLGVAPGPVTETVATYLGLPDTKGAIINHVLPNTTAQALGIKENDIILNVNNRSITDPKDLFEVASRLIENQPVTVTLLRDKKKIEVKGKAIARPLNTATTFGDVTLGELPFNNGLVRTLLFRPKGTTQRLPVIYFLQGYTCFSMQYMPTPFFSYKTAIDQFVKKGYAVFVVEKPGMGDSEGGEPCQQLGFNKVELFMKGYENLLTLKTIDPDNIYIFGHSMGGTIAPILADKFNPNGVAVYGCSVKPTHDYFVDILRYQQPLTGKDYAESEALRATLSPLLYQLFYEKKSPEELIRNDNRNAEYLKQVFQYDGKNQLVHRHYTFWQELNDYNIVSYWKNTKACVLSMFGEADVAAIHPTDLERIATIVNHYHPGRAQYHWVPRTNHDMVETGTMLENIDIQYKNPQKYMEYERDRFNTAVIDKVHDWIQRCNSR